MSPGEGPHGNEEPYSGTEGLFNIGDGVLCGGHCMHTVTKFGTTCGEQSGQQGNFSASVRFSGSEQLTDSVRLSASVDPSEKVQSCTTSRPRHVTLLLTAQSP